METRMTEADRSAEIARARRVKHVNAITALLIGFILAALVLQLGHFGERQFDPLHLAAGFLAGLLYANAFEYILHRFFLHWGAGFLVQRHGLHHDTAGAPEEPRYVNFATSPWVVVLVFALNAITSFFRFSIGSFRATSGSAAHRTTFARRLSNFNKQSLGSEMLGPPTGRVPRAPESGHLGKASHHNDRLLPP